MSSFSISFGTPMHGWLPVQLTVGEKQVEFSTSDALNNPVDDLVGAIQSVLAGREATVWFFLEPGGYWLEFRPAGDMVEFALVFSETGKARDRETFAVQNLPIRTVLGDIWNALRVLQSTDPQEPAWPATNQEQLDAVRTLLRSEG